MKQAISSVLETMFFLPIQTVEGNGLLDRWRTENQAVTQAVIQFTGPVTGSFFLLVPSNMAKEVAANFLGLEEKEVGRDQEEDTVREALNMIGGYVLSRIDKADDFQLGIPEILPEKDFDAELYNDLHKQMIFVETEENHLAAGIHLD
jgi:chemotaxis protein CheY-P-specific phosphatase CheC